MMKIKDLIDEGNKYLHKDHVKIIIGEVLGYNPLEIYNYLEENVEEEKEEKIKKIFFALKEKKPIQYALGKTNFYGYEYKVNENVLIPRFETEELVENTIYYLDKYFNKQAKIIDLGCGSGAIGITIKKERNLCDVTLLDISKKALEVAKENMEYLQTLVTIREGNMLENIEEKYDVIISNPPYISIDEPIEDIVKDNEPHLALYAKEDGLYFYKQILKNVPSHVNSKYMIAFEIGYKQKEKILELIDKYLEDVKVVVKKDLQQRDRMIFIFKNCE